MDDSTLDRRFAALREAVAGANPPPETDAAITAAVARARRNPGRRDRWLAWPLALAASIAALSFIVRSLPPEPVVVQAETPFESASSEFMPIAPLADIENAGDAWVVPARLSRTTVAQLGLPVNPALAADAVDTELLVRRDGSVLAVRFVY